MGGIEFTKFHTTSCGLHASLDAAEAMQQLKQSITQASNHDKPIFILGDFNMHHPHWGSAKVSPRAEGFVKFITEDQQCDILNMHYIPGIPTFRRKKYKSILDFFAILKIRITDL